MRVRGWYFAGLSWSSFSERGRLALGAGRASLTLGRGAEAEAEALVSW